MMRAICAGCAGWVVLAGMKPVTDAFRTTKKRVLSGPGQLALFEGSTSPSRERGGHDRLDFTPFLTEGARQNLIRQTEPSIV